MFGDGPQRVGGQERERSHEQNHKRKEQAACCSANWAGINAAAASRTIVPGSTVPARLKPVIRPKTGGSGGMD